MPAYANVCGEWFKLNVSVISSELSCKDGNARFRTVPLKPLSDQKCERYCRFSRFKGFHCDDYHAFFCSNAQVTFVEKPQLKIIILQNFQY